jgi:hypothetical protein
MPRYTENEQGKRSNIIKSQTKFGDFLDSDSINKLIHLFDQNNKSNDSIVKYVQNERNIRGYNPDIVIKSEVYGTNDENSTLFLKLIKNDIEILHLTIHLISTNLSPNKKGMIHFVKDIYSKNVTRSKYYKLYTLISIEQPYNKKYSLEFTIADNYNTPSNIPKVDIYDHELKREMDVIITVLNRMFDENNNEYYIGNKNKLYFVHNITNNILNNINAHSIYTKRKNKGNKLIPRFNNTKSTITVKYNREKRRTQRKLLHKEY